MQGRTWKRFPKSRIVQSTKEQIPYENSHKREPFHTETDHQLNRISATTTFEIPGETTSTQCRRSETFREERKPLHWNNEKEEILPGDPLMSLDVVEGIIYRIVYYFGLFQQNKHIRITRIWRQRWFGLKIFYETSSRYIRNVSTHLGWDQHSRMFNSCYYIFLSH